MPSKRLASVLALLLLPSLVQAKAWQNVDPGRSTAEEVVTKFGEPTTRVKRDTRTVVVYRGDQALPGTKQAQFVCRADGVVDEIVVFLATPLDADSIEGTYGNPQSKTFTDTFLKVWQYPAKGVTVFFEKDGNVGSIKFTAGAPTTRPEPKAEARPEPKGEAPAGP